MSDNNADTEINVSRLINDNPLGKYQKLIVFLIVFVFIMDGVANTVLPIAIPSLMQDWGLPRDPFKFVVSAGLLGVATGAVLGGMLADRFGRRNVLIACVMLFGFMTVTSAFVSNLQQLVWVRVLDGLGIGGAIPTGMALLFESMPVRRRSIAIGASMVGIPLGGFLAGSIASLVLADYGWHVLFIIGGMGPVLLALVLFLVLPESPGYLVLQPTKWDQLRKLMQRYGHDCPADARYVDDAPKKSKGRVRDLFSMEFRRGTMLLWTAFFFCFIASYSMFSWGPVMMMGQGLSPKTMGMSISAFNFAGILGGLASGWALQKLGSRATVSAYCSGGMAGALLCAYAFQYNAQSLPLTLTGLALFGFFIAGILNLTYTMGANMYPVYIKGSGLGASAGIGRLGAVASAFTGVASLNFGSAMGFFVVIIVATLVTLVVSLLIRQQIPRVA